MLDSFCFAKLVSCYSLIYKPKKVEEYDDYQPDTLPDSLIEGNHNCYNYPKIIKLMNSNDKICCRIVQRVLSIIHQTNINIQRNMPIICFCLFTQLDKK